MIRQATKYDIEAILGLLKNYRDAEIFGLAAKTTREDVMPVISEILAGRGVIFISEKETPRGLIIGYVSPNFWTPQTIEMHEVAFWVDPEYRGGTDAYRLINAYVEYGNKLKEEKRIDFFNVSKMSYSPDLKYDRFGFSKMHEVWIK